MVAQSLCPEPDVIHDLLCGEVPEAAQDELATHFEVCVECRKLFDQEASGPEFLGDAARLATEVAWDRETAAMRKLVQDLPQELSRASDDASMALWSVEAVSEFLEPSENARHLGRLGGYEIVEVIGRGGMGIVLRGIDQKLNRTVAVKVMAPEWASSPNARRRFFREAQAAAAVSHDHVVTIHAVDDSARLPYLVMEFVSGESLDELVKRTGTQSLETTLRIGRQMALGLAAAHEVGLVHRDMKPANILLENGIQRVRITDFGLARAVDDVGITQTGTVTGTPLYMSPEQAAGEAVDHRSDLFSLGSILYTMCTGRAAFRAKTTLAVLKRVCEDTPRPIREVNPGCPKWLVEIIARLMARRPEDRLQSASEVAELLGGHLAHLQDPRQTAPPSVAASPQDSAKRPKTLLKPLLFALLLLVSVIGITEAAGVTHIAEYLGIILRVETKDGTLLVEIEDPNVTVSVDDGEVVVEGAGVKEIRLKPGKHKWTTNRNGIPASTQWVTIERGGQKVLRVKQLPPGTETASTAIPNEKEVPGDSPEPETPKTASNERVTAAPIGDTETIMIGSPGEELTRLTSYDGVVFELPQQMRRFYSGQHVHGPGGEHTFENVPEQLWGQRCTSAIREGGQLKFSVHKPSRRNGHQRLWLIICESDWEIGDGFDTPASLYETGWERWRQINSHPTTDRSGESKESWSIFYKDVGPGESCAIRTNSKRTPLLVWGSIDLDGILCEGHWDQRAGTFGPGASVSVGQGDHVFSGPIPEDLIGRRYTKRNSYLRISRFRVARAQNVVVGLYDWGRMDEGNASGGWQEELTSPAEMKKQGWKEFAQLRATHVQENTPFHEMTWYFYSRDCKAGETFEIRNHKYQAPIVLAELSHRQRGPSPEPRPVDSTSDTSRPSTPEPGAANPKSIRLDRSSIRIQLGPAVGNAGIIGYLSSTMSDLALLYKTASKYRAELEGAGQGSHRAIIGQIAGVHSGDSIVPESFTRTGNQIRILFRQTRFQVPGKNVNPETPGTESGATALYFQASLPLLPPGTYRVEAILVTPLSRPDSSPAGSGFQTFVTEKTTSRVTVSESDIEPAQLKRMAVRAILLPAATDDTAGTPSTQTSTGFDLTELLAHSGQHTALKDFPGDRLKLKAACEQFRADGKQWALCELLNGEIVCRKIYAAQALEKLADVNTVSVLLAAAKRNNYRVDGSVEAELHSEYRVALKKALEGITGLQLTPGFIGTGQVDESAGLETEEPLSQSLEAVDFQRVEEWLRNVYLADASAVSNAAIPQGTVEPGLIGRAVGDGKDTGVIFRYPHAKFFHRDQIPPEVYDHNRFQISLEGFLDVPRDMTVKVWLAGGGVSHDINWLYVDGREIGSTGDNRGKSYTYELPLLKGRHPVKWLLTGGTFRNNILVFLDPESGKLLPLLSRGVASIRRSEDEPLIEINGTNMEWPIPENWLPPAVDKLHGRTKTDSPASAPIPGF